LRGARGQFFQKGGGTPNPFTVSRMPFFRSLISKVCRKNKVSQGISKKSPLAAGGTEHKDRFILSSIFSKNIRKSIDKNQNLLHIIF